MKRIFTLVAVAAASLMMAAQAHAQFGIVAGLTSSKANAGEAVKDVKNIALYHAGLTYKIDLGAGFAIQPAVIYQVKGAKIESVGETTADQLKTGFVEIPVGIQWGPDLMAFRPYVFAEPFILTGDNTFLQHELFKKAGECGLNIKSPLRTESSKIICELVAQDLGVSFLPEYMLRSPFQRSELAVLDVSDFSHSFSMCVYYHRDKWLTPQMAELIELVQAYWGKMSNE